VTAIPSDHQPAPDALKGRVILVTGASGGLGRAAALGLARHGASVTIETEFGRLDGLLHAAAHFKAFTRLEDLEPREWLDSLQINLTAPYTLTRLCLPLLRRSDDASVVFVADEGGRQPKPFHAAYGIAKAAAETMFKTWALELESESQGGSHLRFNSWYPGPLRTALRGKGYAGESMQHLPEPASVLPQLLWLLGPGSRGLSGHAF
jgi:NAD(P)-dependent dehydrogenase (short-subunit alcohol dehydrogenase family)